MIPKIREAARCVGEVSAFVGFDGTVDKLYSVVKEREAPGADFSAFRTIDAFGLAVQALAGESGCIELVPKSEKVGGNGPIMAGALAESGAAVTCMGSFGEPVAPVFETLAARARLLSVANPAVTHALEFNDGKVMLPVLSSYETMTAASITKRWSLEEISGFVAGARLVAMLNWSCLPHLSGIADLFLDKILPRLEKNPERLFFFDLADPAKYSEAVVGQMLEKISAFSAFGQAVLGLNLREAQQVSRVLKLEPPVNKAEALQATAVAIREKLGLSVVMIHPTDGAACATTEGAFYTKGPLCPEPFITTGAGDHLNAGFSLGLALGLTPADSLRLGVLFSGYYVRSGQSPSLGQIENFVGNDFKLTH